MRVQVRVKELAEQQGLSAEILAKKTGIPRATIERIMQDGTVENITVSALARIAEALGVATRALIVDTAREE